ncbi:ImmA/IrrE family metallo-endopeptidase [Glaciimonas sp. PAMC28666]|uniref:ImmA/IrrE family metallo-endopeptidase n=1 Tax=Glaciimonas sp. PAMC28666 TaxID=2807626 RepID=UPI001964C35D|nr:ImmA/IrrE family metallo-endopeptidase [Glaciimonas sp. PAMC28666]QRX80861.1 ImmA/IrrE family metallo-endopeptidase [Glaciimonas sp. PAMC28666]
MHNFKALPMRRVEIRELAFDLRRQLGAANCMWFPILEVVEQVFTRMDLEYFFQVVEKDEMGSSHGLTERDGNSVTIKIRDDIYERAYREEGRDRGTVAHEAGHYLMHARCPSLHRHFGGEIKTCEDPEWQAKCFQGELLIPRELVQGMSADQIVKQCGVSLEAAQY